MSAATCEPPPEHRDKEWHWLRDRRDGSMRPHPWRDGMWPDDCSGGAFCPAACYAAGYRYVGPAIPPQEGE